MKQLWSGGVSLNICCAGSQSWYMHHESRKRVSHMDDIRMGLTKLTDTIEYTPLYDLTGSFTCDLINYLLFCLRSVRMPRLCEQWPSVTIKEPKSQKSGISIERKLCTTCCLQQKLTCYMIRFTKEGSALNKIPWFILDSINARLQYFLLIFFYGRFLQSWSCGIYRWVYSCQNRRGTSSTVFNRIVLANKRLWLEVSQQTNKTGRVKSLEVVRS